MVQYSFSLDDQIDFAKLSGDYNPVHVDSVIARRTRFGHPVVLELHALLWALEILVTSKSNFFKLVSFRHDRICLCEICRRNYLRVAN